MQARKWPLAILLTIGFAILAFSLIRAFPRDPATDPTIDLKSGRILRYEGVYFSSGGGRDRDFLELYTLPETEVDGVPVVPLIVYVEGENIKNTLYLRERSDGLQLIRILSVGGSTWDNSFPHGPYLIKPENSWRSWFDLDNGRIELSCNREETEQSVSVPVGSFTNAVKISCDLIFDGPVTIEAWIVSGTGLVRGQIQGPDFGFASMELVSSGIAQGNELDQRMEHSAMPEPTQGKAFDASAKTDLRNAMMAQEAYFSNYLTYANDKSELDMLRTEGVALVVINATSSEYIMTARHSLGEQTWCVNSRDRRIVAGSFC